MVFLWLEFMVFFIMDLRCSISAFECSWISYSYYDDYEWVYIPSLLP